MHSGFPDVRDQLSMDFARTQVETAGASARDRKSDRAHTGELGNRAGPPWQPEGFLFGTFSIADCMYAPVVSRFTTFDIAVSKPVKDYMARIWVLPGMQAWLKDSQKEVEDGIG